MKTLVITAAYWPTEQLARSKVWIYLRSCAQFGIHPVLYGMGSTQYPGLINMRIVGALATIQANAAGYSHVLYTDSWDAFFMSGMSEIEGKYRAMGAPPVLLSAQNLLFNIADAAQSQYAGMFDHAKPYVYPGVFYLAEIPAMVALFEGMIARGIDPTHSDDMVPWMDALLGGFNPVVDSRSDIFQEYDDNCAVDVGLMKNTLTDSHPCILHCGGGYVSPETGKDDRMIPIARAVGVLS